MHILVKKKPKQELISVTAKSWLSRQSCSRKKRKFRLKLTQKNVYIIVNINKKNRKYKLKIKILMELT